ncbi:hypothetical protein [Nocardia suismassiliense]|uniref:hypothetical protein n=1 Tax=Nocardia suismassiliense TaxID=2077092 RepID=UPI00131F32B0|nr:hypothetical protein [Nocardia suismassiliense]
MIGQTAASDMPEIYDSGLVIALERDLDDLGHEADLNSVALSALFGFLSEFCRPLAIDVSLTYWDDELDVPLRSSELADEYRMLQCATLPRNVTISPWWVGQVVSSVDDLNFANVSKFMQEAVRPNIDAATGSRTVWDALWIRAAMAQLPSAYEVEGDAITVRNGRSVFDHSVEIVNGRQWVCGPQQVNRPSPIVCQMTRDSEMLTLQVSINWSIWAEGQPGFADIKNGVSTLIDDGWRLDEELWEKLK